MCYDKSTSLALFFERRVHHESEKRRDNRNRILREGVMTISNEERLNADIETANKVLKDLIWIGERACSNVSYNYSCTENTINDHFRDMFLSRGYDETKKQTRHGMSSSGKDAGEVDILLTQQGTEMAIFEGLKLSSVDTSYIDTHIKKTIDNYNALGTATFVVAYVKSADYSDFWKRYVEHIQSHDYDVIVKRPIEILAHPNAVTRVASAIFQGMSLISLFILLLLK